MRTLLFVLVLSLLSCGEASDNQNEAQEAEVFGARFKEGKGIELSDVTRASIALEMVEATEEILDDSSTAVTVVPLSALLTTSTGSYVYVENGHHFLRTEVKVGKNDADLLEIIDGLYAGDVVVKSPVNLLWYAELQAIRGGQSCADEH